mgnify:CR=1 FL=1|jgi:hypothetical protein
MILYQYLKEAEKLARHRTISVPPNFIPVIQAPLPKNRNMIKGDNLEDYIIPNNLEFTADEIYSLLHSDQTSKFETAVKYLIDKDPFYIAKVILKYSLLLEDMNRPMMDSVMGDESTMELDPRGSYKTTTRTVSGAIAHIIKNPNISILIMMNSATNAYKVLSEIKAQIRKNARLRYFCGDWYTGSTRWQANSIILGCRTDTANKTGTIDAVGKETKVTSQHYDLIFLDDIADEDDRDSDAERLKTQLTFQDIFDLLNPGGKIHVTGTRWHPQDIYYYIEKKMNPKLIKQGLKPFKVSVKPVRKKDGTLRFPKRYTEKILADLLAKKGIVSYSAQYDLEPLSKENQLFLPANCGYFDMKYFDSTQGVAYGYCDPAMGKNKKGCQAPIITGYYMFEGMYAGKILITDTEIAVRRPTQSYKLIVGKQIRHKYVSFGCEDNAQQSLFIDGIDAMAREMTRLIMGDGKLKDGKPDPDFHPIIVPVQPITNTKNKDSRIEGSEPTYTNHQVLFRMDWESAEGNYMDLMNQLWQYPFHPYKDAPDALECLINRVILGAKLRMATG